ncbi:MAG: NHL repeat-containing protein [Bryobacterales bacterium]|nr:NHL repeat-containing protein [Bryobacterales bacterium]
MGRSQPWRARELTASAAIPGRPTDAQLDSPTGAALDGSGNLYIADSNNHRIRMVDAGGMITTVAGTGTDGFSGDSGRATSAQLNNPIGVAVDSSGNLYIADTRNDRIREVDADGTITTAAGTWSDGFSGDGGPATDAQLDSPIDVAADNGSGNLYIADSNNHRIRMVDAGGMITTAVGTGRRGFNEDGGPATEARLSFPHGVAVDGSGNLYIADTSNNRIRKVDAGGTITTVAGTGRRGFNGDGDPATAAQLNGPYGVVLDGSGNLYIADTRNNRIRKVDAEGTITTVAGMGPPDSTGTAIRQQRHSSTAPPAWRWTAPATSTSPIPTTTTSARSMPRERLPRWPVRGPPDSTGTAIRQPKLNSTVPMTCRWMAPATSTSPITATTASARSMPTGRLRRWRARGRKASAGTAGRQPKLNSETPTE